MYVYAMREMMLGMRLNMLENRIQFEPHIPESLKNNSLPINFEHSIHTLQRPQRYRIIVDPNREKISIIMHNREQIEKEPEIFSNSYSINIEHS
jgi:hypothetical protein